MATQTLTAPKITKYEYKNVIQQNYGFGWEDNSEYEADSKGNSIVMNDKLSPKGHRETLCSHDLREYRATGYATRLIFRKVLRSTI